MEEQNMKKTINFKGLVAMVTAVLTVFFAVVGCDNDDDEKSVVSDNYKAFQVIHKKFYEDYLWTKQSKIPDPETSTEEYYSKFSSPIDMVESFIVSKDKSSWIMTKEEYAEEHPDNGSDGLLGRVHNTNKGLYLIVTLVAEDSPAIASGLHRGCAITKINGTRLTSNNYEKLINKETKTVTFVETSLDESGNIQFSDTETTTPSFSKRDFSWKPIILKKEITTQKGNIGYLLLSLLPSDKELSTAFQDMKIWNVQDLVLDMRFVQKSYTIDLLKTLASYIVSSKAIGKSFLTYKWNENLTAKNASQTVFDKKDDNLSLKRIFILTSEYGSNLLIAGIRPYIDVTIIGENIHDSDNYGTVKYTCSEWIFEMVKCELLDPDGNTIVAPAADYNVEDNGCIALGDPSEPLLAKALELINK
ncbi:MAG: hypothetical protein IKQ30_04340 [Bacteroidales bacterium]|nr:hypothetical protein [Bacteroidales bacterium]